MTRTKDRRKKHSQQDNLGSFEVYIHVVKLAVFFFVFYAIMYLTVHEYPLAIAYFICAVANIVMLFLSPSYFPFFIIAEHLMLSAISCLAVARLGWGCGIQYLLPMSIALGFFAPFKNENTMTIINVLEALLFIVLYIVFHDKKIDYNPVLHSAVPVIHTFSSITCSVCVIFATRMTDVANAVKNLKMSNVNSELAVLANQDGLTKLYNRRAMQEIIEGLWKKHQETAEDFWLVMCDIDYFKQINDTAGHDAGDNALISVASVLQNNFRSTDYIARWGGDEFLVAITGSMDSQTAKCSLGKVISRIAEIPYTKLGISAPISVTMGASSSIGKESLEHLIRSADENLYDGKKKGRNTAVVV